MFFFFVIYFYTFLDVIFILICFLFSTFSVLLSLNVHFILCSVIYDG